MAARSPGRPPQSGMTSTAAAAQHARRPRARGRPSWCPPRASTPGTAHPGSGQPRRETRPSCPCAARPPPASPAEPAAFRPPGIPVAAISGVTGRSGSSGRRRLPSGSARTRRAQNIHSASPPTALLPGTKACRSAEVRASSRTPRSPNVMRSVSWQASGRSRTAPNSRERHGARFGGVRMSSAARPATG